MVESAGSRVKGLEFVDGNCRLMAPKRTIAVRARGRNVALEANTCTLRACLVSEVNCENNNNNHN